MGYTHYWRQDNGPATDEQWNEITSTFRKLITHCPVKIQREENNRKPPEITDEHIIFNGAGKNAHETMVLEKDGPGFNFCKTARKPYDLPVTALLILAHHYAPGVWQITSDGTPDEWLPALDWLTTNLEANTYEVPKKLQLH